MLESEQKKATDKSWLTESVALFLTPALGYFLAFSYEQGYCGTFGFPSYLIKPDLSEILIFATVAIGYWFFLFWVFDAWLDIGRVNPDPRLRPWQHLIGRYLPLYTLFSVILILYLGFWRKWVFFLGIILFFPLADMITALLRKANGKTFAEKWKENNLWADSDSVFFRVRARLGRSGSLLLAFVFLGSLLAGILGNSTALRQTSFLVPSSNTNAIVVRYFGDKFICAKLDPNTRRPIKTFVILSANSDTNLEFKSEEIGPLNFQ
jgi:hypothetical protein